MKEDFLSQLAKIVGQDYVSTAPKNYISILATRVHRSRVGPTTLSCPEQWPKCSR